MFWRMCSSLWAVSHSTFLHRLYLSPHTSCVISEMASSDTSACNSIYMYIYIHNELFRNSNLLRLHACRYLVQNSVPALPTSLALNMYTIIPTYKPHTQLKTTCLNIIVLLVQHFIRHTLWTAWSLGRGQTHWNLNSVASHRHERIVAHSRGTRVFSTLAHTVQATAILLHILVGTCMCSGTSYDTG